MCSAKAACAVNVLKKSEKTFNGFDAVKMTLWSAFFCATEQPALKVGTK